MQNIFVTIIVLAVLMIVDYVLILNGYALYKRTHAKFVDDAESPDVNPLFKKHLDQKKYNLSHFLSIVVVAIVLYSVHYLTTNNLYYFNPWAYPFFSGLLLSRFIYANARHLQNLVVYYALHKDVSLLSGKIKQKKLYSLYVSSAHALGVIFIMLFVLFFTPSWFNLGFALGPLPIISKNIVWMKKYTKHSKK